MRFGGWITCVPAGKENPITPSRRRTNIPGMLQQHNVLNLHWWWNRMWYQWKKIHWQMQYLRSLRGLGEMTIRRTMEVSDSFWVLSIQWRKNESLRMVYLQLKVNCESQMKRFSSPAPGGRKSGGSGQDLIIWRWEPQWRLNSQPQQVCYAKARDPPNKEEMGPKTCDGNIWMNILENPSPRSPRTSWACGSAQKWYLCLSRSTQLHAHFFLIPSGRKTWSSLNSHGDRKRFTFLITPQGHVNSCGMKGPEPSEYASERHIGWLHRWHYANWLWWAISDKSMGGISNSMRIWALPALLKMSGDQWPETCPITSPK